MESKIKCVIIGYGYIGKRHAEMITGHPNLELIAIADPDVKQRVKAKENGLQAYETAGKMFEGVKGQGVEIACICTPNGIHARGAIEALENGCHVIIEKPMGLNRAECESVLHKSLQVSKQVFCVMQNRYTPTANWLKEVVYSGILGRINLVQVNCFWNRNDLYYSRSSWKGTRDMDGGPMFTQFSHFVDLLYWTFGDIQDVTGQFACFNHSHNTDFEDTGQINFSLVSGGLGSFNYSTSVHESNYESSILILAENGTVKVGGQYMDKVIDCDIKGYQMPELPASNPPNDYGDYKGSAANHHFVFQNVVDTLKGNTSIMTNALEGMKVVEIIERVYRLRQ